ncbi:MAG TPA: S24 family peptidase, partial [Telluria sp.]
GFDASPLKNKGATSRDDAGAFLFTVPDSSMDDAGIMQGEKVVVDRSVAPEHGRLVIAKLNGEFTLKRLFQFNGRLELRSENEAQAALRIPADEAVQLWGVVVGVIRNYTR